jgi:hypothetical protein
VPRTQSKATGEDSRFYIQFGERRTANEHEHEFEFEFEFEFDG